jgi:hypothetical protein
VLGLIAAVAVAAFAFVGHGAAAPKPGFLPGTWIGKGTISGNGPATEGPATTFSGTIDFVLVASPGGKVKGSGNWSRTMVGTGNVSATIVAKTRVKVAGTTTTPRLVGSYRAIGTFTGHGVTTTSTFAPVSLNEKLVITRAGKCRVTGSHTFNGVTTRWTAQLKGSGTCRA